LMYSIEDGSVANITCTRPPIRSVIAGAAIGHVQHVDAGHHLEQLAADVDRRSNARRRHIELARIGFGIGNEIRDRLGRNRWIDDHDERLATDAGDRRNIAHEVVIELWVERGIDGVGRTDQQERVSVGGRIHDHLGRDVATGARPVLNND
jgi:hypothetical protein